VSSLFLGSKAVPGDAEERCPCAFAWELLFTGLWWCCTILPWATELVPGAAAGRLLFCV